MVKHSVVLGNRCSALHPHFKSLKEALMSWLQNNLNFFVLHQVLYCKHYKHIPGALFFIFVYLFQKAISIKRLAQVEEVLRARQEFKQLETQSNTTWFVLNEKYVSALQGHRHICLCVLGQHYDKSLHIHNLFLQNKRKISNEFQQRE